MRLIRKAITWNVNLLATPTPIAPAFQTFEITEPSALTISGHVGLKHRGNYSTVQGQPCSAGWGLLAGLRGPAPTQADVMPTFSPSGPYPQKWVCATAGNIGHPAHLDGAAHYAYPALHGLHLIETPGWYRFELWGSCHGSTIGNPPNLPATSSVVEINPEGAQSASPYLLNCIVLRIEPYETQ